MHPDKKRNAFLRAAELNLYNARANLAKVAAEVQAECPHTVVYQVDHGWSNTSPRICPKCGLEHDSHSTALGTNHWTPKHFVKDCPLVNHEDRLVVVVDKDEFMRRRPGYYPA